METAPEEGAAVSVVPTALAVVTASTTSTTTAHTNATGPLWHRECRIDVSRGFSILYFLFYKLYFHFNFHFFY